VDPRAEQEIIAIEATREMSWAGSNGFVM